MLRYVRLSLILVPLFGFGGTGCCDYGAKRMLDAQGKTHVIPGWLPGWIRSDPCPTCQVEAPCGVVAGEPDAESR